MPTHLVREKVTIAQEGKIELPERIRIAGGFKAGDELLILWLPPDELIDRTICSP